MLGEILKALKSHKISAKNGRANGTVKLEEILKYIRKHQGANRTEISNALNIPIRTVSRYLKHFPIKSNSVAPRKLAGIL